jgi:hypothetical protein
MAGVVVGVVSVKWSERVKMQAAGLAATSGYVKK